MVDQENRKHIGDYGSINLSARRVKHEVAFSMGNSKMLHLRQTVAEGTEGTARAFVGSVPTWVAQ